MPRKVRSHLNPCYKPVFVFFRLSHPLDSICSFLFLRQMSLFFPFSLSPSLSFPLLSFAHSMSSIVSVAIPLFFHVTPFLSSNQLAITSQPPPPFSLSSPLRTSRISCVSTAQPLLHREQYCAPTVNLFGHDNMLLRNLIILVVGVFRVIFGSTTHFIITFTAVISCARCAANELHRTLSSNLLEAAPQRLFRFRAVITTPADVVS